jgi:hypothetical protein
MWHFKYCAGSRPQRFPLIRLLVLGLLIFAILPQGELIAQSYAPIRAPEFPDFEADEAIKVAPQKVKTGVAGQMRINLQLPEGYHLNPRAPLHYSISVSGAGMTIAESDRIGQTIAPPLPLVIPFRTAAGTHQATADIDMTFYYCREDDTGVCVMQSVRWQVSLHIEPDGSASEAVISYKAEAPVEQKRL